MSSLEIFDIGTNKAFFSTVRANIACQIVHFVDYWQSRDIHKAKLSFMRKIIFCISREEFGSQLKTPSLLNAGKIICFVTVSLNTRKQPNICYFSGFIKNLYSSTNSNIIRANQCLGRLTAYILLE